MTIIMSGLYPRFVEALSQKGYRVVTTKPAAIFHRPEQLHADMQLLIIRHRLFTLDNCQNPPQRDYPDNIRLNGLWLGNCFFGKLSAIDPSVLTYCREQGIEPVNVSQGYTRCSTLAVNDRAVITADSSIETAVRQSGAEVLRIQSGHIRLDGYPYGFIGGASGVIGNTVVFFGNVTRHPDYSRMKGFIKENDSNIEILCPDEPLTDIGGLVVIP